MDYSKMKKAQLSEEVEALRKKTAELERAQAQQKRAEESLQESEQNFRDLVENSPDGIIIADETGRHLFANRRAAEITGYSIEELQSITIREMTLPEELEKYKQRYEKRIEGESVPKQYERLIVRKDGTTVLTELTTTTTVWQGKACGMATIRDITERVRAEEALRRSLEETAHSQRLLLALSQAAQAVQRARIPEAVYRAIGEQVTKLGFDATVFTLSDDRMHLIVSDFTLKSDLVRAAEKLTGLSAEGYRFPLTPGGFFQRIVAGGETVFSHLDSAPVAEALPRPVRPLAGRLVGLFGWQQSIIAPLTIGGEVGGLLAVTGANLTESDVPTITVFANQAAIALENARLYEAVQQELTERKQAEEELEQHREHLEELVRERTAELRTVINAMTGREVRMAGLKKVIKKLRAQLEEAGLEPVADDPLLGGS